ncbi:MAG: DNA polymerase III subunit gamma/tau [Gammaproteobacteria bacterium]|nr:DNA polymerase III subunit gamma/tau [Rhodocyclaceae bacterium]MBU3907949.1 DNA polymerase III subunit gamma/tau [Gammaproteobacteria bacterium]MBU3989791.1 DNA polymerase III subunit gamma/tau [Gammaproteobacteria bacterium]MBU4003855.1 DNA polymerase III subunit gamma/tau [Gammaproteobacteria bacterium]MBU4021733.1 DNA polymerase III subunit gamma/tau [Gammaproteobacteria bacterium]
MSYQVLARKWRPKSFDTLVGQEHVVRALTHALDQQRLHHAYLFTGTRGVGKTTLARILAKALNCETGITSTPCGVCGACLEIDSGRFIDYVEMDAASNRGVEDMAALLEKAAYAPNSGRYKVYMIDEVHQLSGHAFNAMLKTLEEPPEHVKFILATTDPQKIPVTVLSRCLQFNLKQMPPGLIVDHLTQVLAAEEVDCEATALRHLAKAAAGSMRDALSLLDQAIAHGAGRIEEEGVRAMLGTVGDDHLFSLLDGLVAGDIHAMLAVAEIMEARSLSFDSALQELATLFHRIALVQFAPSAILDAAERERLAHYAECLDAEFLQLCYQIAIHGRDELALAPDEAAGFGMVLLRLHAFRPDNAKVGAGGTAQPAPANTGTVQPTRHNARVEPTRTTAAAASLPPPSQPDSSPAADDNDWHALVAQLPLTGMARQLAQHCELITLTDRQITLRMSSVHKHLAPQQEKLQAELQKHYGRPLALKIDLAETAGETPKVRADNVKRERQERAIAAIEGDPFVREVCDLFDASIDESTIKPI